MGEGAGDEEEDGESEDGYEDGHGTGGTVVTLLLGAKLGDMSTARKF
jgi:hypothetical protein